MRILETVLHVSAYLSAYSAHQRQLIDQFLAICPKIMNIVKNAFAFLAVESLKKGLHAEKPKIESGRLYIYIQVKLYACIFAYLG